jgi:lysophospholipase L1-like esterase
MLDRTYEAWKTEARRIGAPLTLLILPRADSKTESPSLFQLFRDQADRHAIPYIDLSGAFDRFDLDDYRIAPWDHHPNAMGHQLIFERLRDSMIIDRKFLDRID